MTTIPAPAPAPATAASQAWRTYSSAPGAGAVVCRGNEVAQGSARCLVVTTDKGEFPLVLVRLDGALRGYVNACPHQDLPLDYRSGTVLSANGERLMCSAHGAAFEARTGRCLSGAPEGLDPVPLVEDADGLVRVGD